MTAYEEMVKGQREWDTEQRRIRYAGHGDIFTESDYRAYEKQTTNTIKLYRYCWKNNAKRVSLYGRSCRVVCRGRMNSAEVEFFDNGQREIVSRNALRRSYVN